MKKTITLLALGGLTLALLAFAFVSAQAKPEGNVLLQATTTGTASGNGSGNNSGNGNNNGNAAATPQPGSLNANIAVWDQFCVRKVPYTLIAIRQNASFEMTNSSDGSNGTDGSNSGNNNSGNNSNATGAVITPTPVKGTGNNNEIVCNNVGVFRDRQVIVCRGPQLYSFPISVTTDGTAEEFMVPLGACPGPRPSGDAPATTATTAP